ncbi:MAG TPA: L,D-transpeptidase [Pyrinomonadaceae bacterium]|nr:L,D-transpeptidase [Pyrinomonadaceae bacterium]
MISRLVSAALLAALLLALCGGSLRAARAQDFIRYDRFESERSDRLTGGRIETAEFEPGQPDVRLTLNVPSFRLTLWQNGREVRSYYVGVGKKDYPIYIGARRATEVIYNPDWIPPASDWVAGRRGVRPGQIIRASDPRNPLGKVKIPLGDAYLIHQAAAASDLGNLVSHGCVRMLLADLYDLSGKLAAARSAPATAQQVAAARRNSRQLVVPLGDPVPVDINYDTLVVEGGRLHVYPDVYGRRTNTVARLREELRASGVNARAVGDETLQAMLDRVTPRTAFVVEARSIERGDPLAEGRLVPLVERRTRPQTRPRRAGTRAGARR